MNHSEYTEYLRSDHWADLREKAHVRDCRKFCLCACGNNLNVHHIRYKNLYDCTTEDLVTLCEPCHFYLHQALKALRAEPDHYPELWQMKEAIDWYQNTPRGIKIKAKREARLTGKRIRREAARETRSFKRKCKAVINTFFSARSTPDAAIKLIAALERLVKQEKGKPGLGI